MTLLILLSDTECHQAQIEIGVLNIVSGEMRSLQILEFEVYSPRVTGCITVHSLARRNTVEELVNGHRTRCGTSA